MECLLCYCFLYLNIIGLLLLYCWEDTSICPPFHHLTETSRDQSEVDRLREEEEVFTPTREVEVPMDQEMLEDDGDGQDQDFPMEDSPLLVEPAVSSQPKEGEKQTD